MKFVMPLLEKKSNVEIVFIDGNKTSNIIKAYKKKIIPQQNLTVLSKAFKTEIKSKTKSLNNISLDNVSRFCDTVSDSNQNIYSFKTLKKKNQLHNFVVGSLQNKCSKSEKTNNSKGNKNDDETDIEESESDNEEISTKQSIMPVSSQNLYFSHVSNIKSVSKTTSDHTLKKLKGKKLNRKQVNSKLSSLSLNQFIKKLESAKNDLNKANKRIFNDWTIYLDEGYNVLLYGFGSKRSLLHSYCNQVLEYEDKIVVNGFFSKISIKSILSDICSDIIGLKLFSLEVEEMLNTVVSYYSKLNNKLYLVIHNIDGINLRPHYCQVVLSKLANTPGINMIASIDHINASLIWEQKLALSFNWLTFDATTFQPYKYETSNEGSLALQGGFVEGQCNGGLVLSGLLHVTESLTRNAKACFKLLVEDHLETESNKNNEEQGMSFAELYRKCREKFIVNSEINLRAHLTEFLDHKLLLMKKSLDGSDFLVVPLAKNVLEEYLEQENN